MYMMTEKKGQKFFSEEAEVEALVEAEVEALVEAEVEALVEADVDVDVDVDVADVVVVDDDSGGPINAPHFAAEYIAISLMGGPNPNDLQARAICSYRNCDS